MRSTTQSEQRCFRRCSREHYYAYLQRYRSLVQADALRFGTLIHAALEAYWSQLDPADSTAPSGLNAALTVLRSAEVAAFELATAEALLIGYDARWRSEPFEVLGVEQQFEAPLVNPATGQHSKTYTLSGKLDAVVRAADGRVYIVEHKTSGEDISPGSPYWRRLRIDAQVSAYYVGAQALGYEVAGCLYDVIGKPKLKPLKATPLDQRKYTQKTGALYASQRADDETPDEFEARLLEHISLEPDKYYQRGVVVRLEDEEREAGFDVWQTARVIREAELLKRHPRNPDACMRYGRPCEYFDVCTGAANLEDPTRFKQVDSPHQELTRAAE